MSAIGIVLLTAALAGLATAAACAVASTNKQRFYR